MPFNVARHRAFRHVLSAICLMIPAIAAAQHPEHSAVGMWTTISDDDGKPEAVVEIRDTPQGLVGIVRALLVPATHDDSICGRCTDERKGQPVIGMEILRHMQPDGEDEWSRGEILDPENGKIYKAKMHLDDDGRKLVVRGYVGFSLFGRSQTWIRR